MVHFGFSYIGVIWLILFLLPNLLRDKNKSKDTKSENKILKMIERIGIALCSVLCLLFSDFNIRPSTVWSIWLVASAVLMVIHAFTGRRRTALPCISFLFLGIYGTNSFLITASLIFFIGRIGIHRANKNRGSKISKIVKGILLTPVVLFLLFTIVAIAGRNINWFKGYIDTSKGVNESIYVDIGGQEQYMLIRGRDVSNPVILYLHGGPAGPDSAISDTFTNPLIDDYTVVCWDQRGCGRTYYRNMDSDSENKTVNFERALQDTDEVVDYLCDIFDTDKVIVIGHSYGSLLGSTYVRLHPEKVIAYIGIGQFVDCIKSDEIMYQDALSAAMAQGEDTTSLEEAYAEYSQGDSLIEYMVLRNATAPYHQATYTANSALLAVFSPYAGVDDVIWTMKQGDLDSYYELNRSLFDLVYNMNLYDQDMTYEVPTFFISGGCDYTCNSSLAESYCNDIDSPLKDFVLMEGHGHCPHYASPEEWAQTVKEMLSKVI